MSQPFDARFVVWSKCSCGSSSTSFRGKLGIESVPNCWLHAHRICCDLVLFDTTRKNRVCAFIFAAKNAHVIPAQLEAVGGWPCPVLVVPTASVQHLSKIRGVSSRHQSLKLRRCNKCVSKALHNRRWMKARRAFLAWKSNCRFFYVPK